MIDSIEQKKKAIHQEVEKLREEFYVELPKRIAEARSLGDLKENSEYDAARERQAFVKARIAQLSRMLAQYSEAATSSKEENKIGFGSVVVVLELNSNTRSEYTIVHPAEVDPDAGTAADFRPHDPPVQIDKPRNEPAVGGVARAIERERQIAR